jgi:HCOMODA/2-hydroxy-3-carboxy-muconic semialdehyde decarboxylase
VREKQVMTELDLAVRDLVIANRILAHEAVVDAYGHVSVRHPHDPKRYLLSCSRSPELVQHTDIQEFNLDGIPLGADKRQPYFERFIHGAIYEARPDVHAVVHSHADEVLPFSITSMPLRPVILTASAIGAHIPVWDIRDRFGDTNLLVANMAQGRDLASCLGEDRVVLMRGHGFAATGRSLLEVVKISVYMPRNAQILQDAMRLGEVKGLSRGEIEIRATVKPDAPDMRRAWEYWAMRAGCSSLSANDSPGSSPGIKSL